MGLLDIFKSSSKAVDTAADIAGKTTDGLISGIDKMFYTDEEKGDAAQKAFDGRLKFQLAMMQESLPAALSRRILAWVISGVYLLLVIFACLIWKWFPEWAKFVIDNGVARTEFAFGAVVATYFIYHGVREAMKKK